MFYLVVQTLKTVIVDEFIIGTVDANGQVLSVRIFRSHLPFFIIEEFFKAHLGSSPFPLGNSIVSQPWIRINGK